MKDKKEIYISIDIETNGSNPGLNSMLSLGAAAFLRDESNGTSSWCLEAVATFSANLKPMYNTNPDPKTMEFWSKNEAAYKATQENQLAPEIAIPTFNQWAKDVAKTHNAKPKAVCYPVSFDWPFVSYYMARYTVEPFTHACIDMKSVAFALLGTPYGQSGKRSWPKEWRVQTKHSHVAVEDAIEQGQQFIKILQAIDKENEKVIVS